MEAGLILRSPLDGWVSTLDEVPDPVFAERMMGDGVAIDPTSCTLMAPCDGTLVLVAPTHHSVTIRASNGAEMLIHIGLDTVALKGVGFTSHVRTGQEVKEGDRLISFDLDAVLAGAKSLLTPILLTNGEGHEFVPRASGGSVRAGDILGEVRRTGAGSTEHKTDNAWQTGEVEVRLAHGIHARPAGRIAAVARSFSSEVRLRAHGREANGRSPVAIMGLGIGQGDALEIATCGGDGAEALGALRRLIGSLEETETVTRPGVPHPAVAHRAGEIGGVCAVPGMAIGPAFRLRHEEREIVEMGSGAELERQRLKSALIAVEGRLFRTAADPSGSGASIAAAHLELLRDPEIAASARRLIDENKSAEFAWRQALRAPAEALNATGNALLEERIADLQDLERQVLQLLAGDQGGSAAQPPSGAIVIGEDILPSHLMEWDLRHLAGICTARGGPTSHAAIIAAGGGIPMVVAAGDAISAIADGETVLLDASRGRLVAAPSEEARADAKRAMAAFKARREQEAAAASEPGRTSDGSRIEVFANLGAVAEAASAVAAGAEGCGLLRTEFLFLDRTDAPSEEEQFRAYQGIADALGERPLIVRTLDIGGDKPAPYLAIPPEENPALGLRGIRTSLWRPELLDSQLRAILRVSPAGRCRIMIPMVSMLSELRFVRGRIDALSAELGLDQRVELGIMIETPAAAVLAGQLAAEADFFSVGSNDLTQYALAMDRGNPLVAPQLSGFHPAVLRLIEEAARGAAEHGRPLGVCGGLASLPTGAIILVGLGATELSMPAASVGRIKALLRLVSAEQCHEVAARALDVVSAEEAEAIASELVRATQERTA